MNDIMEYISTYMYSSTVILKKRNKSHKEKQKQP